jgi:hypothetical protein
MTTFKTLLASTAVALVLSAPAFAANTTDVKAETKVEDSSNGGYTKTSTASKSTPSGSVSDKAKTDLDVSNNGDSTKTTTVEHTNDPKGLMNKTTAKSKTVVKKTGNTTSVESTKKLDGNTVSDTKTESSY